MLPCSLSDPSNSVPPIAMPLYTSCAYIVASPCVISEYRCVLAGNAQSSESSRCSTVVVVVVTVGGTGVHCEYHSFSNSHMYPDVQHCGPAQSAPPHCCHGPEQLGLACTVVVVVVACTVVVVTSGGAGVHCEYQSFCNSHKCPEVQHCGPAHSTPPHCCHGSEQLGLACKNLFCPVLATMWIRQTQAR